MAKRFTDSNKWNDAWFMGLPSKYKLFWLYILDECNHAGIWKVNFKVASFFIGEHLEYSEVKRILSSRIIILDDEYWYLSKFIKYQYKCEIEQLNVNNKAHLSVLKLLNEYQYFKPLTSPLIGVKDKDKEKDNNKVKPIEEIEVEQELAKKLKYQNEQEFLKDWNNARVKMLRVQHSSIKKLYTEELTNFNKLRLDFTIDEFKNGIRGLMKQKDMYSSNKLRPSHFLKDRNIEKYIDCFENKTQLFEDKKDKKALSI